MRPIRLVVAAVTAVSLTACHPFTSTASNPRVDAPRNAEMATVTVVLGAFSPRSSAPGFGVQMVPTNEIKSARVEIRGPGMPDDSVQPTITDGKGAFLNVQVPMGPNRVFTAYALRANGSEYKDKQNKPVIVRAVKTIEAGKNEVVLDWASTPAGEVFDHLLKTDVELAKTTSATAVQQLVNTMITWGSNNFMPAPLKMHPSLIDGAKIAADINGTTIPGVSPNYLKPWGKVQLIVNGLKADQTYDAWLEDPASPQLIGGAEGQLQLIGPVLAGTWRLRIVIRGAANTAENLIEEDVVLVGGQTRKITVDLAGPTDGNIDFTSYPGAVAPDLSGVPLLVKDTHFKVSGNDL